jgi:hypothetical protein
MDKHKHCDLIIAWANGAVIQFSRYSTWVDCASNSPSWNIDINYRIKPIEFNWSSIASEWKYFAKDRDGRWFVYTEKPKLDRICWRATSQQRSECIGLGDVLNLPVVNWDGSLICR